MSETNFSNYNLSDEITKALEVLGYNVPTPVQQKMIPLLFEGRDVIVKSQTGSGKTASFAIPLCEMLDWEENKPQALVLTPTRELALQVKEEIFHIGRFRRLKVEAIFGKASFEGQRKQLKQKTHVVVGTPGRIMDHIEKGTIDLSGIKYLIIDEADEMLKMGFEEQMEAIFDELPEKRLSVLLSATMPEDIHRICEEYMHEPTYLEIEQENKVLDRINQYGYMIDEDQKEALLKDVLVIEHPDSCIIFCNTQLQVDELYEQFFWNTENAQKLHGGMEQRDRIKVINDFKHGYFRFLIATDVAARGLDIDDVSLIINYDFPKEEELYIHRIGRTGRIDNSGKAISLVGFNEKKFLNKINEFLEKDIPIKKTPSADEVEKHQATYDKKLHSNLKIKKEKGSEFKTEIMKLHINAGKKTRMRASDIVGALCSIKGMSADDIGIISIVDVSTFVEILNNKGELVYKALQSMPIKGRIRKVNKANQTKYEQDYEKQGY